MGQAANVVARTPVRQAVRDASATLRAAGVPESGASAAVLMAELLDVRRGDVAQLERPLTPEEAATYGAWIRRRLMREPVQRILGYAYFRNLRLGLNEHALIPRPDTESVVDAALARIDERGSSCRVLDVGTGSGAIAVSIAQERPGCEVHAADLSEGALEVARENAASAGVEVHFHLSDLAAGLDALHGKVDVLVSNPPYVRSTEIPGLSPEVRAWDPPAALDGGPDGLELYRRIFLETPPLLRTGADVVLEVGDDQAEAVLELGRASGFAAVGTADDLAGTPRVALLRWGGVL